MRPLWKGIYISNYIRYQLYFNMEKVIKVKNCNIKIINEFLDYVFILYNGKKFYELVIQSKHLNFFLGQFVFSRKIDNIHKKIKNIKKCHR